MYKGLSIFLKAVKNEISIDKNVLKRLGREELSFTPVRPIKSLSYIDKYSISGFLYSIISVFFWVLSPLYFLIQAIQFSFVKRGGGHDLSNDLVFVANSRIEHLMTRINVKSRLSYLNINQPNTTNQSSVYTQLSRSDYWLAYLYALSSIFYLWWHLKDKKDILQAYVAYEWFLVYIGLSKINCNNCTIYFANHYDRWAVMFDQLFARNNLVLLQHGLLPDSLQLSYQLKNINYIYSLTLDSHRRFKSLFNCESVRFSQLDLSIKLTDVQSSKRTVLMIGQPHSIKSEINIIKSLKNEFNIFVKPHPLYDATEYKKLDGITLIEDKGFYPNVDVALCYESTLGIEYEASGIQVLWWKGMDVNDIYPAIKKIVIY